MKNQPVRGKFITIEGLDGCGKSTQLERLAKVLSTEGLEIMLTREPGGTPIGERIRAVLLDSRTQALAPMAELALMFASRAQQVEENIKPALAEGKWVLCDRFTDSSEAYQGGGRQLGSERVLALHQALLGDFQPDMTILMDSDVAASVARARRRNQKTEGEGDENRFERENRAFFTRVHDKYMEIARRDAKRVFVVDARKQADTVYPQIVEAVRSRMLDVRIE